MDPHALIAAVLWAGFLASLVAVIAGLLAGRHGRQRLALGLLFVAVLGTLAFSFIGGFSIGRFTAIIPVLVIGYVVGIGRRPAAIALCLIAAVVVYVAFSWLFTPLVLTGGALSVVFGAWAIPTYAVLAFAAFAWAAAKAPRGDSAPVQRGHPGRPQ